MLGSDSPRRVPPIWLAAGASGLICLFVYLLTLLPGVSFGDSAEFQRVPAELGIPHPTGFPVYVLLGKLFSLIPLESIAWRAKNAFRCGCEQRVRCGGSLYGAIGRSADPRRWRGDGCRVHGHRLGRGCDRGGERGTSAFHVARHPPRERVGRSKVPRDLYLGALLVGLAVANHPTAIALSPLIVVYVLWTGRVELRKRPAMLVRAGLAGLVGLTPYLLLWLRAAIGGNDLYRFISTWDGFTYWVTGAQMRVSMRYVLSIDGITNFVPGLPSWIWTLVERTNPMFVVLACIGLIVASARHRALSVVTAGLVVVSAYHYINYLPTLGGICS